MEWGAPPVDPIVPLQPVAPPRVARAVDPREVFEDAGLVETIKRNLPLRDEARLERTSKGVRRASQVKREARASQLRDDRQARSVADLARSRYRAPRVTTSVRSSGAHETFRQNERDRGDPSRPDPAKVPQFLQSFVEGRDPFTPDPRDRNPLEPGNISMRETLGNMAVRGSARAVNTVGRLRGADEDLFDLDEQSRDFRREVRKKAMDERLVDRLGRPIDRGRPPGPSTFVDRDDFDRLYPNRKPQTTEQDGDGLLRYAGNALNRVVDAVGEKADLPPGQAREWAYYALLQMINAAQQQSISYDEYYSLKGDELISVLQGSGIDWKRVGEVAGDIGNAAAVAGLGTAATGIGAAATPFLEGAAGVAKGVEFAASMLGSGTDLDDALRDLYGTAQTIAKRERLNPAQVAEAVRNLRGAPMVRANRGLVSNTDLADSNYVVALETTLQSQRKLPRRRSGAPEKLAAQPRTSRRGVKYYQGVKHAR
jgi:hypothetical protein